MEASMSVADYDLIVIGGGPAGEKGAAQAAYFGKRVALVERSPTLGGAVANASIPFKALRETALFLAGYRTRNLHGIDFHLKERATLRDFLAQEHALVRDYRFKVATNLDHHADWYRLLDLCGMTDTLIGDADGVYHPGAFNDRLVLGLKGTMSEAELHVLRARLEGGIRNKAARGELRRALPVGLVWGEPMARFAFIPTKP
jgi:glycine/D-amino acid oxidase-like deaminating enzyme